MAAPIKMTFTVSIEVDPESYEMAYGVPAGKTREEKADFRREVMGYVQEVINGGVASDSGITNANVRR